MGDIQDTFDDGTHHMNYKSYEELREQADSTLETEHSKGFLEWFSNYDDIVATYGNPIFSKIAVLAKKGDPDAVRIGASAS